MCVCVHIYLYLYLYLYLSIYLSIYIMDYYSALKKKKILPFVTIGMKLEGIILSETSQTEKDKYCRESDVWNFFEKLN